MRVRLDDHELSVSGSSLDDALAAAAAQAEEAGRIIVEVVVDGRTLAESDLASTEQRAATPEAVELTSADFGETVSRTLADAGEALLEADHLQRAAAASFQADRSIEGYEAFQQALGIWTDVQRAVVTVTSAIGISLDDVPCGDSNGAAGIQRLNELLLTLREAVESQDPVGLADTLMYDMPDITTDWRELIIGLSERVGAVLS